MVCSGRYDISTQREVLYASVPIAVDDLRPGSAWKLPRSFFGAVPYGDDPNRANVRRQAQDFLHFLVVERPHETGTQTLIHHRKQYEHRDEGTVDDAEETDAS